MILPLWFKIVLTIFLFFLGASVYSFLNVVIAFIISVYMLISRETLLHTVRHLSSAFLRERTVRLAAHYSNKAADIFK